MLRIFQRFGKCIFALSATPLLRTTHTSENKLTTLISSHCDEECRKSYASDGITDESVEQREHRIRERYIQCMLRCTQRCSLQPNTKKQLSPDYDTA